MADRGHGQPEMTLAAGNALCDVTVNYCWEEGRRPVSELCRQTCSLTGHMGGLGRGHECWEGGLQSWRLCGAAWGLDVPAPGGPGEEGRMGAGEVTTLGGHRPRSAAQPPPSAQPPSQRREGPAVCPSGLCSQMPTVSSRNLWDGGSCTLRTKSGFFTWPDPTHPPPLATPILGSSSASCPACCLCVSGAPGCAQARPSPPPGTQGAWTHPVAPQTQTPIR